MLSWVKVEGIKTVVVMDKTGWESSLLLSWIQGEVIKVVVMAKRGGNQTCCHG